MFQWMRNPLRSTLGFFRGGSSHPYQEKYQDSAYNKHASLSHVDWLQAEDVRATVTAVICKQANSDNNQLDILKLVETELQKSASVCETVSLRDCGGYNLLQLAIINNVPSVVKYLITQGAEINVPICGRPLHLAAKLGYTEIVNMLIEYGADTQVMGCVCYPHSHPSSAKTLYNSDTECWTLVCPGDLYSQSNSKLVHFDFPLFFAIQSDSVECVTNILDSNGSSLNMDSSPLHVSCKNGSYECMMYFINESREMVNKADSSGYTPLQYAIKWGEKFAQYLICNGAAVLVKTPKNENLLHLLFKETKVISELSRTVKYLLDCGVHMNINTMDDDGNSALNLLLKLLYGSEIRSYLQSKSGLEEHCNKIYEEVWQSVHMLLEAKANPNICNKDGDRSLHILVQVGNTPFEVLYKLLSLLLQHRANANFANKKDGTILGLLVCNGTKHRLGNSVQSLTHVKNSDVDLFVDCIKLLHTHGCRFDRSRLTQTDCLLHQLFAYLDTLEIVSNMPVDLLNRTKLGSGSVRYIQKITQCLLECGCRPNTCKAEQSDLNCLYYKLISKSDVVPFEQTRNLLLLLLQYGADANKGANHIAMSVFRRRAHLQPYSIFPMLHLMNLWGSDKCTYSHPQILMLFRIFYSVMDPAESTKCLKKYFEVDFNRADKVQSQESDDLDKYAQSLLDNPKSLKTICAMNIYDLLEKRILLSRKLPLPKPLSEYLCSFQY